MESPEGVIYEGEWIRGDPYGRGIMTWPDGRRYEGEFRIGDPHGQGVMTWPDGRRDGGVFRIGELLERRHSAVVSKDGGG